jgi:hypothetical protein
MFTNWIGKIHINVLEPSTFDMMFLDLEILYDLSIVHLKCEHFVVIIYYFPGQFFIFQRIFNFEEQNLIFSCIQIFKMVCFPKS